MTSVPPVPPSWFPVQFGVTVQPRVPEKAEVVNVRCGAAVPLLPGIVGSLGVSFTPDGVEIYTSLGMPIPGLPSLSLGFRVLDWEDLTSLRKRLFGR